MRVPAGARRWPGAWCAGSAASRASGGCALFTYLLQNICGPQPVPERVYGRQLSRTLCPPCIGATPTGKAKSSLVSDTRLSRLARDAHARARLRTRANTSGSGSWTLNVQHELASARSLLQAAAQRSGLVVTTAVADMALSLQNRRADDTEGSCTHWSRMTAHRRASSGRTACEAEADGVEVFEAEKLADFSQLEAGRPRGGGTRPRCHGARRARRVCAVLFTSRIYIT